MSKYGSRLSKAVGAALLAVLLGALSVGVSGGAAAAAQAAQYIGEARARAIALEHAGIPEAEATVVKMKRYDKRGRMLYDIVFLSKDARYSYDIDASTGEILAHYRNERRGGEANRSAQSGEYGDYIGMERAKEIAFAHAKVSPSEVRKLKVELDRDHGRMIYEIDFEVGRTDYEYEIDALTGEILMWEADRD